MIGAHLRRILNTVIEGPKTEAELFGYQVMET